MLDWVSGVLGSTKVASDIAKSLVDLKADAAVNSKAVELTTVLLQLQQQLMSAQMEQMALINKLREVEGELDQAKQRAFDEKAYKPHQFSTGALAYVKREAPEAGTPLAYLCTSCFEQGIKISLQVSPGNQSVQAMKCPKCATTITTKAPTWMCSPIN